MTPLFERLVRLKKCNQLEWYDYSNNTTAVKMISHSTISYEWILSKKHASDNAWGEWNRMRWDCKQIIISRVSKIDKKNYTIWLCKYCGIQKGDSQSTLTLAYFLFPRGCTALCCFRSYRCRSFRPTSPWATKSSSDCGSSPRWLSRSSCRCFHWN